MRCEVGWWCRWVGGGKDLNWVKKKANRKDVVCLIFPPEGQIREERFLTAAISRNFGLVVLVLDMSLIFGGGGDFRKSN